MYWKIEDMSMNHQFNSNLYQTLSSGTISVPGTQETQVDLTIRIRGWSGYDLGSIENFEKAMLSREFENEKFTEQEILHALYETYPERFI